MEKIKSNNRSFVRALVIAMLANLGISLLLLIGYALLLVFTGISDTSMDLVVQTVLVTAISLSTIIGGIKLQNHKCILGLLNGLIFTMFLSASSVIFFGAQFVLDIFIVAKLVLGLVAGFAGGMVSSMASDNVGKRASMIGAMILLLIFSIYSCNSFINSDYITAMTMNPQELEAIEQEAVELQKEVIESANQNFFEEYKQERDKNREKIFTMWEEVISNPHTNDATKKTAKEEINKVVTTMEKEMQIEELIKNSGFKDAITFIAESEATVIVEAGELTQEQAEQIKGVVVDKTKLAPEAIKIMKTGYGGQ